MDNLKGWWIISCKDFHRLILWCILFWSYLFHGIPRRKGDGKLIPLSTASEWHIFNHILWWYIDKTVVLVKMKKKNVGEATLKKRANVLNICLKRQWPSDGKQEKRTKAVTIRDAYFFWTNARVLLYPSAPSCWKLVMLPSGCNKWRGSWVSSTGTGQGTQHRVKKRSGIYSLHFISMRWSMLIWLLDSKGIILRYLGLYLINFAGAYSWENRQPLACLLFIWRDEGTHPSITGLLQL